MFYHAEINKDSICFAVGASPNKVLGDNIVELQTYNESLLGQRYNNGTWEPVEIPELPPTPLTETEQAILDTAVNVEYLVTINELKI